MNTAKEKTKNNKNHKKKINKQRWYLKLME